MEKYVKSPILLQNFIHGVLFQVLTFLNNSVVSDNISGSSVAEWLWLNSERTVIKQGACQRLLTLHCSYSTMCQMHQNINKKLHQLLLYREIVLLIIKHNTRTQNIRLSTQNLQYKKYTFIDHVIYVIKAIVVECFE